MEETPNRKFSDNYFWDVLPSVATELKPSVDKDGATTDESHLKSIARNILSNDKTEGSNTFDISIMDADILSALQLYKVNDDDSNETTEVVDMTIGKKYTVKVNKFSHNKLSCTDIYASGITKNDSARSYSC